ncbi:hypothetical protein, partial [Staphylococcus aureus]
MSRGLGDVYKRQVNVFKYVYLADFQQRRPAPPVSYTHLRAHETLSDLVCRLLLEKKHIRIPP